MNFILNQLLTLVLAYGYPIVGLSVVISSIGFPFPTPIILLAAGALAALGELNFYVLFFIVLCCSVLGDITDYWLGAKLGYAILRRFNKHKSSMKLFGKGRKYFFRWSGITIFLTRWLFSIIASVISLLAGTTGYPFGKFLLFDIPGQIISAFVFLGLGYLFSSEWQNIWTYVQSVSLLMSGILVGTILIIFGIKQYNRKK
ncbi:MAG TPA: VTT domain-containing protein [Patescibacteria group bacterium]|nr:VTT domain-containing protein [Patescibacteria group bacterium]